MNRLKKTGWIALAFLSCHLFAVYTFLLISDFGGQWRAMNFSVISVLIMPWILMVWAYPFSLPFVLPFAIPGIAFVATRQRQPLALFLAAGGLCGLAAMLFVTLVAKDFIMFADRRAVPIASFLAGLVGGGTFKLFLRT